jgi:histidinol-phosphate phosphatase family protein
VVFSNQSGVARGYFSEEAVHAINQRLDELLHDANPKAVIDRHDFCPYHPDASIEKYRQDSPLRKPGPGMILAAAEALALDLSRSWVIGDAPRDIEAGHAAGCRTILFTDPTLKSSPAAQSEPKVEPDYICSTLKEALDFIEANTQRDAEEEAHTPAEPEPEREPAQSPEPAPAPSPASSSENMDLVADMSIEVAGRGSAKRQAAADAKNQASTAQAPGGVSTSKLESLSLEILHELRRRHEQPEQDFSVSKLLAGIVQVIVLFVLFLALLNRGDEKSLTPLLLFALTLQAMTIALLIMGRQR